MNMNKLIAGSTGVALLVVCGCVSAERIAEYNEWRASADGVASVSLTEFEAKYQPGWRSRASEKRAVREAFERITRHMPPERKARCFSRLTSEDKSVREREERIVLEVDQKKQAEYELWQRMNKDSVKGVTREAFEREYKNKKEWQAQIQQIRRQEAEAVAEARRQEAEAVAEAQRQEAEARRQEEMKEAESRHQARIRTLRWRRNKFLEDRVESDLKEMRKNPDLLSNGLRPRLKLTEQDKLAGEALLSEFGTKFMPNTYGSYEKIKEGAAELQQIFNEEFPSPEKITNTSPQWQAFNKVLEKFVKVRAEYFQCHDELCHYWTLYRLGVLTAEDLATLDGQPPAVQLLPEQNADQFHARFGLPKELTEKEAVFAAKYSPETFAIYQALDREREQLYALLKEVGKQRRLIDAARFDRAYYSACFKMKELCNELITIRQDLQTWYAEHRIAEKSSEEIAKLDQGRAKGLKAFVDSLPTSIKDRTQGPAISVRDMVKLPNGLWMMRTEVTQMQWMVVMGENPSRYKNSADRPVECVSWNDCQEFIKKLNVLAGRQYRLPTGKEWEFACRAGGSGSYGKRRNGECGPLETMGWNWKNSRSGTQPVAMKEPNVWGLFDMHGNVREWNADLLKTGYENREQCGGSWRDSECFLDYRERAHESSRDGSCGFRLCE